MIDLINAAATNPTNSDIIASLLSSLSSSYLSYEIDEFNYITTKVIQNLNTITTIRTSSIDSIVSTYNTTMDIRTLTTILSCYLKYHEYQKAMDIFYLMKKNNLSLDAVSQSSSSPSPLLSSLIGMLSRRDTCSIILIPMERYDDLIGRGSYCS